MFLFLCFDTCTFKLVLMLCALKHYIHVHVHVSCPILFYLL